VHPREKVTIERLQEEIDWYQNDWPWSSWPLFSIKVMSCQPLRYMRCWISRKPLEIAAWFHRTTNRMAYGESNNGVNNDVTW